MAKTILFAVAAAASLMGAFFMGPSEDKFDADEFIGERLNPFEVEDAKRLKIVKFDKETRQQREFEVAESDGLWTIPSKQNYPADAVDQMAAAATCLIDREVLRVAATSAGEHKTLGVLDPSSSRSGTDFEGVGIRVSISDSKDETLADMVIGKPVKDAEGQHYVRNTNQDLVYVINIDPEKLSTKFSDWIEDDLLQLSPLDIRRVTIKDYSAMMQRVLTLQGTLQSRVAMDPRNEFELRYDDKESKWVAESLQEYDQGSKQFIDFDLPEGEELNEDVLRELRNGLDELLLVDVERKPEGLGADLKAGEGFLDSEAANNLFDRGFAPMEQSVDKEIISSEGEVSCTLESGVEYVLRFGNLKSDSTAEESSAEESNSETDAGDSTPANLGIHRYLFIMARFNKDMLEAPVLEGLPELPEGVTEEDLAASETEAEEEPESQPAGDEAADADAPTEEEEEESEETEATDSEAVEADATSGAETASEESPTEESPTEESPTEESPTEESPTEESPTEESPTEESPTEEPTSEEPADAIIESEESKALADLIAQRKLIEEENKRKLDEYQDKIEQGEKRVKELNERFGDWYYVIDNKVFEKIHIGRDQLFKKKGEEDGEESKNAAPQGIPGLPGLPVGGAP